MLYNVKPLVKQLIAAAKLDAGLTIVYCDKELSDRILATREMELAYPSEWSTDVARVLRNDSLKEYKMAEKWLIDTYPNREHTAADDRINNEADIVVKFGILENSLPYMCVLKARTIVEKMPGFPIRRGIHLIPVTNHIAVENQNDGADIEEGMVIVRRQGFRSDDMSSVVFNRERAVGFVQIPDLGIDWVVSTPVLATPVILLRGLCVPNEELGGVSHPGIPFSYIVREAEGYARNLLLLSAHGDPRVTPGNKQVSEMLQEYATAVITNNRSIAFPEYGNYDYGRKAITFTAKYGQLSSITIDLDK